MKVGSQSKTNPSFSRATDPYSETLMNYYTHRTVCFSMFVNIYYHGDEKKRRKEKCSVRVEEKYVLLKVLVEKKEL